MKYKALSGWGWGKGSIADPETTTPNGCSCASLCGATISDGFSKDWCYTKGPESCGSFSLKGYWDYCEYLNSKRPTYRAMTWKQKQDHLWAQIIEDDTFGQYYASELPTESVITSFDDEWDVMPNGRHKVIHSVGAICQFEINISPDSPYTGLLKVKQRQFYKYNFFITAYPWKKLRDFDVLCFSGWSKRARIDSYGPCH